MITTSKLCPRCGKEFDSEKVVCLDCMAAMEYRQPPTMLTELERAVVDMACSFVIEVNKYVAEDPILRQLKYDVPGLFDAVDALLAVREGKG